MKKNDCKFVYTCYNNFLEGFSSFFFFFSDSFVVHNKQCNFRFHSYATVLEGRDFELVYDGDRLGLTIELEAGIAFSIGLCASCSQTQLGPIKNPYSREKN